MKKKNGFIIELEREPEGGYRSVNTAQIHRSLNAWAKRRGLSWDVSFCRDRSNFVFGNGKKTPVRKEQLSTA